MNKIMKKTLAEMRKKSRSTTKALIEQSSNMKKNEEKASKKTNNKKVNKKTDNKNIKKVNKKTDVKEVEELKVPTIIVVSFYIMIAFLSFKTLF